MFSLSFKLKKKARVFIKMLEWQMDTRYYKSCTLKLFNIGL